MKLRISLSLRRCLLACLAGLGGLSASAGTTLTAEGVTYGDELNSSRFFDTGKGYYFSWDSYFWPELNKLYKQYGNFSFLGDVYDRIPPSANQLNYDSITDDAYTCWAQVSMNLVEYWHSYYGVFCNDSRKLIYGRTYDHKFLDATGGTLSLKQNLVFLDTFTNDGDSIWSYLDWMMLGYENPWYTKIEQSGKGGFWKDYFFTNSHSWGCDLVESADISSGSISSLTSGLLRLLGFTRQADGSYEQTTKGQLVYVGMTGISGGGHAITCHGVELDSNGQVMAMYVTNSDDMEYKLFKLYIKERNGAIALYENEACTKLWEYSDTGWVIDGIESIRTPEALKTKLAQYENAENPLRWTGSGSTWKTHPSTAIADALPDDSTGWKVEVDGEYFPIYYLDSERKVEFNDSASSGRVQVDGGVAAAEMMLNNRTLAYDFSGGQIAADTLTAHATGRASFTGVALSGSLASLQGYTLSLGKGSSMAYTTATLGSGSTLMFNGGSARFTTLTMSSGSSIELVASSSLTSTTLQASSGVSFVFSSGEARLTYTGSISASAPITLVYEPDIDINAQCALITFTKGLSNWATCFTVADGVLSYANNTLYFTYLPLQLEWTSGSGTWSPSRWKDTAQETMGALARFGGSSSYTVTLSGSVVPALVEVSNSSGNITFAGSGKITGNARLSKSNNGTLTINNANAFTGGTSITGGTLQVGHAQALGSGDISLQNATLDLNNKSLSNAIYAEGTSAITHGGSYTGELTVQGGVLSGNVNLARTAMLNGGEVAAVLSGAGGVNITGRVTLSGANSYSGGTSLSSADVIASSASAFGAGPVSSAGNTTIAVAFGSTLKLEKNISNTGTLTLKGAFNVTSFDTQALADSYIDAAGRVGRSGFLCSGGYTTQVVNGGTTVTDKAVIMHNGNMLSVSSDGVGTYEGSVDYSSYLVAGGSSIGVKAIKAAAVSGGSSVCDIELTSGCLVVDANIDGALTVAGGTLSLDGSKRIQISGTLTLNSDSYVDLASGFYEDGTYTLLTANGGILMNGESCGDCLTVRNPGARAEYTFYVQGKDLRLGIVTKRLVLVWNGGKKGTWGLEQNAFWKSDGKAASFANGDNVEFNQQANVTIVGEVIPGDIVVSSEKAVVFTGDKASKGCIAGHANLLKIGSGVLTINADNDDWDGSIQVQQGTLKAGRDDAFGEGVIEVSNGATLDFGGKKVDAFVSVTDSACLKNGKNFEGHLTLHGDVLKGSLVNIASWAVAEWYSGELNGTISGSGELLVMGDAKLGSAGKVNVAYLTLLEGSQLAVSSKGLALSAKNSILTVNGGVVDSEGKLSTNELQMTGGEISIDTAKAMSLDIKGKTT
ncbi:MAG: autotransporter-associated beta strand repeat-containing protein, partial [Akkermansia sp.]|nr:autotransporter-associated beta strand repeat-containing protein [Akkermansia sp.]